MTVWEMIAKQFACKSRIEIGQNKSKENFVNITGYTGPSQAAGGKSSCMPDPPLARIN